MKKLTERQQTAKLPKAEVGQSGTKPSIGTASSTPVCSIDHTCPKCGYQLEAMALRCPRCLSEIRGWSCSDCKAKSLCHGGFRRATP